MNSIYNANDTNTTNATNKNEKETEMEAFPQLAKGNFLQKRKKFTIKP